MNSVLPTRHYRLGINDSTRKTTRFNLKKSSTNIVTHMYEMPNNNANHQYGCVCVDRLAGCVCKCARYEKYCAHWMCVAVVVVVRFSFNLKQVKSATQLIMRMLRWSLSLLVPCKNIGHNVLNALDILKNVFHAYSFPIFQNCTFFKQNSRKTVCFFVLTKCEQTLA